MAQIVGSHCGVCGERISSMLDGEFCPECKNPVHNACKTATQEEASCWLCGTVASRVEDNAESVTGGRSRNTAHSMISHLFSFRGRVSRGTYFAHSLLDGIVIMAMVFGIGLVARTLGELGELLGTVGVLGVLVAGTWSVVAVTVKRLHDIECPGWHWFLSFVPLYNIYLGLVLLLKPGTVGDNQYGTDPLVPVKARGTVFSSLLTVWR